MKKLDESVCTVSTASNSINAILQVSTAHVEVRGGGVNKK